MKKIIRSVFSLITALVMLFSVIPFGITASAVSFNRIVNAATAVIISNEGTYSTVVKNDVGALSIGIICWHGTNALNLLKEIIALNSSQALGILGADLYNEIITRSEWDTRIATTGEAAVLSVLLSTSEGKKVQNKAAAEYISRYIAHGQSLGISEPEALVFFADYENQNGKTGAENFIRKVKSTYGTLNLTTLYNTTNKSSRRAKTYNFCATINWNSYSDTLQSGIYDSQPPAISNVSLDKLSETGYTVSCEVTDNNAVAVVYFAVYFESDGTNGIKWYNQIPANNKVSHTVDINEFSSRAGAYRTFIYAFDEAGNYQYAELNSITVPEKQEAAQLTVTVSGIGETKKGETLRWSAAAANGSGSYQYYYEVFRDDTLVARKKYSDYSDFEYTPNESGLYYAKVTVLDTVSEKTAEAESIKAGIFEPIEMQAFSANTSAAIIGQPVTWTLSATEGEGKLKYSYTVYKDNTAIGSTDYSESPSFTFKATEGGSYKIVANVIDSRSQTASFESDTVTVIEPLSVKNAAFSVPYAVKNMNVTVSADVRGGSGEYTVCFDIFKGEKKVISSGEIKENSFSFTVTESGSYTAQITVTDKDSTEATAKSEKLTAADKAERGDANCDGSVNAADARFALRCAAKLDEVQKELEYAVDISGDGNITAGDARTILRISARLEE